MEIEQEYILEAKNSIKNCKLKLNKILKDEI